MRMETSWIRLLPALGSAWMLAFGAAAQSDSTPQTDIPAKLPYGVADVLKLSHAQVSEEVISTYIHNSGTVYNLAPSDIVYLKQQGVSDRIVNQMLDQRRTMAEASTQTAAASAQPQPGYTYAPQPAPAPTYVQPAVSFAPVSTVYTIPYPAATYAYYGYGYRPYYCGPNYGGYYGFGYPSLSFSFGFGGHYGGYRGYGGYH